MLKSSTHPMLLCSFQCNFFVLRKLADELEPKNIKILQYNADLSTMHFASFDLYGLF